MVGTGALLDARNSFNVSIEQAVKVWTYLVVCECLYAKCIRVRDARNSFTVSFDQANRSCICACVSASVC